MKLFLASLLAVSICYPHYQESLGATMPPEVKAEKVVLQKVELSTKEKVAKAFNNDSRFLADIQCESGFNQFKAGKPNISPTSDVGVMQINKANWSDAKSRGLDIFNSVDDNIAYGKILFSERGYSPWVCDTLLWKKIAKQTQPSQNQVSSTSTIQQQLAPLIQQNLTNVIPVNNPLPVLINPIGV